MGAKLLRTINAIALFLVLAIIPMVSLQAGQTFNGNVNGGNRNHNGNGNMNRPASNKERHNRKKAEKFVNAHDARDGRLDGRGPRRRP